MDSDKDIESIVRKWAEEALFLLRDLLGLMAPVGGYTEWQGDELHTIRNLLTACARSSESTLLLVAYQQLWDAEMLQRSVAEGTLKFCYLLHDPAFFRQRHNEYAEDLFQVGRLRDHRKAEELLTAVENPDADEWAPIRNILLSEDNLAELTTAYPSRERRILEQRWGFARLLGSLSRHDPAFQRVSVLGHGYAISSHLQHVDSIGASLPFDREYRSTERRAALHCSHAARLVMDVLWLFLLRATVGYKFVQHDSKPLVAARQHITSMTEPLRVAYADWLKVEYR